MMTPMDVMTATGGRRFLLSVATGLGCTALVWYTKITDLVFRDIIIATVGFYIAGNTVERIKGPTP